MNIEFCVLFQEVPPVDSDDDVVVLDRKGDEIPVLPTALADVRHVGRVVAARLGYRDEFAVQALIDEKNGPSAARRERACRLPIWSKGCVGPALYRLDAVDRQAWIVPEDLLGAVTGPEIVENGPR
jgi:hypothetical protein